MLSYVLIGAGAVLIDCAAPPQQDAVRTFLLVGGGITVTAGAAVFLAAIGHAITRPKRRER